MLLCSSAVSDMDWQRVSGWIGKQLAHSYERKELLGTVAKEGAWVLTPFGFWPWVLGVDPGEKLLMLLGAPHISPQTTRLLHKRRIGGVRLGWQKLREMVDAAQSPSFYDKLITLGRLHGWAAWRLHSDDVRRSTLERTHAI